MRAAKSVWFVYALDETIQVSVVKKRMRSLRLRVRADGTVVCSVPWLTTKRAATAFIVSRADWIKQTVAAVAARNASKNDLPADSAAVAAGFSLADCTDGYSAAWKKAAQNHFSQTVARFLPCFAENPIPQFALKGRAMKSLWGSCNRRTNTITLNWALFAAPQACIDYVVLHELTHFLYIHHDKAFYNFIAAHMSDYKARIKTLRSLRIAY